MMMKITQKTYKKLWIFILLSLGLKLILFAFKYFNAYTYYSAYPVRMFDVSFPLVNPDELEYLSRAKEGFIGSYLGQHWLYEWINSSVYEFIHDTDKSFILLCLFNIVMSLGYPFLLLPIIRSFSISNHHYNQIFLTYSSVILFWPSAIWMAIGNMKDTLLGLMIGGYISCLTNVNFAIEKPHLSRQDKIYLFFLFLLLMILGFLIFSTRSYIALILIVSTLCHLMLNKQASNFHKLGFILIIILGLMGSGIIDLIFKVVEEGNSFLLNPEKAEEAAALANAASPVEQKFEVSYNIISITRNILLFYLGAFPNVEQNLSFISFLLVIQTLFSVFFIKSIVMSLKNFIWQHKLRYFYIPYFALTSLFYGIVSLNGPRQRLATIDLFIIVFVVAYLGTGNHYKKFDLILGLCIYTSMLIFTNRMILS